MAVPAAVDVRQPAQRGPAPLDAPVASTVGSPARGSDGDRGSGSSPSQERLLRIAAMVREMEGRVPARAGRGRRRAAA